MIEVEIKLKITKQPVDQLEEMLTSAGFVYRETIVQEDRYYDNTDSFVRRSGQALRLRNIQEENGKQETVITFKGKKLDGISMTRQELETTVGELTVLDEILQALQFHVVPPIVRKTRKEYVLNVDHANECEELNGKNKEVKEMHACVDLVEGLGAFLELEIMAEEDNRKTALDKIESMLQSLGYSLEETSTNSYLSMLQGVVD